MGWLWNRKQLWESRYVLATGNRRFIIGEAHVSQRSTFCSMKRIFYLCLLLLLLLSCFSRVRLCATPWTAAYQASPSMGFSRQEHCSGLPFLSPMHASGQWKWSRSVVSNSSRPHGLQPTRLLHPWDFPGNSTGVGCHCLLPVSTWMQT